MVSEGVALNSLLRYLNEMGHQVNTENFGKPLILPHQPFFDILVGSNVDLYSFAMRSHFNSDKF